MSSGKEGNTGKGTSQFYSPDKAQPSSGFQRAPLTSPGDLAGRREIFFELMKGVPDAYAQIEPAILNATGRRQSDDHNSRRPYDATDAPRAPHDNPVEQFRSFIQQEQSARDAEISPQAIIQERLSELATTAVSGADKAREWDRLASAWDALTHDSYPLGSIWERRAGYRLYHRYKSTHNPIIELLHDETLILGALAEAAGSPLNRGIAVIEIPEHLRDVERVTRIQGTRQQSQRGT